MANANNGAGAPSRIVIIGGGSGGAYCAKALDRQVRRWRRRTNADVLVIDRHNYFVFYPLLVEAGTGSLEPRHVVVPIRDFTGRGELVMAEVTGADLVGRTVRYRLVGDDEELELPYDHLVVAPGSVTRLPDVPGLDAHGRQMKSLGDAVALRDRAIELLERANATADAAERRALLRFIVVGGNFTGVEVAGEFDEFLRRGSDRYPNVSRADCGLTLIEKEERILGALGDDLGAFALRHLRGRGVDVRIGRMVDRVAADHVVLDSGERLESHTTIWCAGIAPSPLVARLDLPTDERGYILCERDLRVRGHENVWAIGDSAVNPDAEGAAYPATAQHATRQGRHLAMNLAAVLGGRATTPCNLSSLGSLAALGCRTGVARVFGVKLSGFPAWWLWRTVYLMKMPRLARRIRVALDWSMDLLFARDYVQLGVHRGDDVKH